MSEATTLESQEQTHSADQEQDPGTSQDENPANLKTDADQTQNGDTKRDATDGKPTFEPSQAEESKINTEYVYKENLQIKNLDLLLEGLVFNKHSSWTDPAYKTVRISECLTKIEWFSRGQTKPRNFILLSKLIGVRFGRRSGTFKKQKIRSFAQEQKSFSLLAEDKTLDLEADLKESMELFLEGLASLIEYHKKNNSEFLKGTSILGKTTK